MEYGSFCENVEKKVLFLIVWLFVENFVYLYGISKKKSFDIICFGCVYVCGEKYGEWVRYSFVGHKKNNFFFLKKSNLLLLFGVFLMSCGFLVKYKNRNTRSVKK